MSSTSHGHESRALPARKAARTITIARVKEDGPLELATVLAERYRIDRLVASGGFGVVYAGHHLVLDTAVAIKVLRAERLGEGSQRGEAIAAFLSEARMLARLRHAHIVAVLDAGVLGGASLPWM